MHRHRLISSAGGSTLADLLQALEDYLPVVLGLVKNGKACVSPFVYDVCYLQDKYQILLLVFMVQEAIYSIKYNLLG